MARESQVHSGQPVCGLQALLARQPLSRCSPMQAPERQDVPRLCENGVPSPLDNSQLLQVSSLPMTLHSEISSLLLRCLTLLHDQGCMQTFALICKMIHIIREKS